MLRGNTQAVYAENNWSSSWQGVETDWFTINGWEIARLWLYLLGSAMLTLVGVQLVVYWVLLRVLEELSQRDIRSRDEFTA